MQPSNGVRERPVIAPVITRISQPVAKKSGPVTKPQKDRIIFIALRHFAKCIVIGVAISIVALVSLYAFPKLLGLSALPAAKIALAAQILAFGTVFCSLVAAVHKGVGLIKLRTQAIAQKKLAAPIGVITKPKQKVPKGKKNYDKAESYAKTNKPWDNTIALMRYFYAMKHNYKDSAEKFKDLLENRTFLPTTTIKGRNFLRKFQKEYDNPQRYEIERLNILKFMHFMALKFYCEATETGSDDAQISYSDWAKYPALREYTTKPVKEDIAITKDFQVSSFRAFYHQSVCLYAHGILGVKDRFETRLENLKKAKEKLLKKKNPSKVKLDSLEKDEQRLLSMRDHFKGQLDDLKKDKLRFAKFLLVLSSASKLKDPISIATRSYLYRCDRRELFHKGAKRENFVKLIEKKYSKENMDSEELDNLTKCTSMTHTNCDVLQTTSSRSEEVLAYLGMKKFGIKIIKDLREAAKETTEKGKNAAEYLKVLKKSKKFTELFLYLELLEKSKGKEKPTKPPLAIMPSKPTKKEKQSNKEKQAGIVQPTAKVPSNAGNGHFLQNLVVAKVVGNQISNIVSSSHGGGPSGGGKGLLDLFL